MNCIYFCRFVILLIGLSLIRLINANSIGLSDEVMQSLNMVHVRLAAEAENLNYEQAIAYMRADYLDALANEDQYHADNNIERKTCRLVSVLAEGDCSRMSDYVNRDVDVASLLEVKVQSLEVNINYFGSIAGIGDTPAGNTGSYWGRMLGWGLGVNLAVGVLSAEVCTTMPAMEIPYPSKFKVATNPVTDNDINMPIAMPDPRKFKFHRPQIGGFGLALDAKEFVNGLHGQLNAKTRLKDLFNKKEKLTVGVGAGIGYVDQTSENWLQLNGVPIPIYSGPVMTEETKIVPLGDKDPSENYFKRILRELITSVLPKFSPYQTKAR